MTVDGEGRPLSGAVVIRNVVAGSLTKRLGMEEGTPLPLPAGSVEEQVPLLAAQRPGKTI